MKFYQKRGFALVVLVLAILGSCVYGISKKPADLPQVSYGNWLRDDADLLTDETEASLRQYDQSWDSDYRAIIAVATLDTLNGWTYEKAAAELGSQWGLGGNDMRQRAGRHDGHLSGGPAGRCGDSLLSGGLRRSGAGLLPAGGCVLCPDAGPSAERRQLFRL